MSPQTKPDFWPKASVALSMLSSLLVAAMGAYVTYSVSHSQIEVARAKNADDTRLQEARIASDMFQELVKSDAKHRAAVLVMIEPYLPKERYTQLCAALAREDVDPRVRQVASQQLRSIATDLSASSKDRGIAQRNMSALDHAQFLRTLSNPQSRLQIKLTVDGCCVEGQEMRIQLQNLSQVPLFVVIIDVDPTGAVILLFPDGASPYLLQPNAIVTQRVTAAAPFGTDVIRAIGSKSPITNIDEPTLRKLNPADWCTQAHFAVLSQEQR